MVFIVQRRQTLKILYNASQVALSITLGTLVFLAISGGNAKALEGVGFVEAGLRLAVPTIVMVVVTWMTNAVLM
ncbi:MAG TPA: hypothetical protein VJ717_15745, partial [Gemmatimonadaceae bacterium]|nr:hypothetical protein [Gemmatimonadaceae bacterium]